MPGSNASSDGFDRSPLHAEGGGAAAEEEEQPEVKAEATEQPGADTGDEKMNEEATGADTAGGGDKKAPNLGPTPQPSGNTTAGKIFIGGLNLDTTEEDLKAFFETFGELTDVVVMRDKQTGRGRGFGFVTFADSANVDKVIVDNGKHEIKGRSVDVKSAVKREEMDKSDRRGYGSSAPAEDDTPVKKVFVGGLDANTGEDDLKEYFGKFGAVAEVQIMVDPNTQRSRNFGFVTFESADSVKDVVKAGEHTIQDKKVEVKKAFPRGQTNRDDRG
eukprot:CAMPEP_0173071612 /NCGR_PEP_ID=MMETSP1102-20130122/9333_1 /TAXON_ID=49646 /ORGANISM="Geminigera sp., Strain Caron Lab Isolate" /LENGTH=273 /DNA_ID=CAMNT_0013940139 /DNA_START=89 /DNA_END=907 /DNA_ORIENTATION=+